MIDGTLTIFFLREKFVMVYSRVMTSLTHLYGYLVDNMQ